MRKVFSILAAILMTASVYAQSPEKMSYQAVIRNSSDALVTNTQIGMEINIRQGSPTGTVVYTETQTPTTNIYGLVSVEIGGGAGFSTINWASDIYFIETKTAIVPPLTTYTITGVSQLLSVPYALHAKTAETITGGITETDPVFNVWDKNYNDLNNKPTLFSGSFLDLTNKPTTVAGYGITDAFNGNYNNLTNLPNLNLINTDNQQLTVSTTGDTLRLQNGGFVIIPGISAVNTPAQLATLFTATASSITDTNAVSGGNISNSGGANITARGIVWSTNQNPTLDNNLGSTNNGNGTGSYTSYLTGLTASTTYYARAYATNSAGTAFGAQVSFTTSASSGGFVSNPGVGVTYNGYTYPTINLGNGQEWMAENLHTTVYANGNTIPNVTDQNQWRNLSTGAWVNYNNDSQYETPYGKLYNWYTVTDPRNVCPTGWHVPTDAEWSAFINYIDTSANSGGSSNIAGGKMKSIGTQYWLNPNTAATNLSGFSGLPGGTCDDYGSFYYIGNWGGWWSSTQYLSSDAWHRDLNNTSGYANRSASDKNFGLSVRCLRN